MAASAGPLQGLTFGQMLDRILRLVRRNLRIFLKLGTVPAAGIVLSCGMLALSLAISGALKQPAHAPLQAKILVRTVPTALAGALLMVASYVLFEAAATYTALAANVGETVPFGAACGMVWSRCGRFLWLMVLRALVIGLPVAIPFAVVGGLAAMALHSERGQLAPGLWFLLFPLLALMYVGAILYAILMTLRLSLAPAACIAEDVPAVTALRRSGQLTRDAKGRIFLVLLVVYAAGYLVMMVFELGCMALFGLGALAASVGNIRFVPPWNNIGICVLAIGGLAIFLVWMAVMWSSYAVALAVLYHDQRYRTEGILPEKPQAGLPAG